jgi:AraC-like DNA-binding protein
MFYREYTPHPVLRPYVKCLWALEHDYASGFHREEWLAASAEIDLIFHFGSPYEALSNGAGAHLSGCFVMGQQDRHTVLKSAGSTGLVAVRFQPWGAFPFFKLPVSELANQVLSLESILGREAVEMEERLQGVESRDALRLLESFCVARIKTFDDELVVVKASASRIIQSGGQIRIPALLQRQGVTQRQVERQFQTYVGMSPKRLTKLVRFRTALQHILANPGQELTGIAYDCGYFDQAHFTKDFRQFYGKTPAEVRAGARMSASPDFDVEFLQSPRRPGPLG